ncbi:MAM domain-containing glycosylphosphatidylinositol anchor protein 2-like isoform X1 [Tachysurus ichikawai]
MTNKDDGIILISIHYKSIRWTKTAGSVSDRFQDSSVFNETLHIAKIQRHQGGRYYCKAENGLGSPAIKSIRVDVYSYPKLMQSLQCS